MPLASVPKKNGKISENLQMAFSFFNHAITSRWFESKRHTKRQRPGIRLTLRY